MRAGIPKELRFGYSLGLTMLEIVFIVTFVIGLPVAAVLYRKWLIRSIQPTPEEASSKNEEREKTKKYINMMNGTLESIADDIEKSKAKLRQLQGDMNRNNETEAEITLNKPN